MILRFARYILMIFSLYYHDIIHMSEKKIRGAKMTQNDHNCVTKILRSLAFFPWGFSGDSVFLKCKFGPQGVQPTLRSPPFDRFLGMGGGGQFFFLSIFKKIEKNRKKIDFFFRSESHLGCSKCVFSHFGAPRTHFEHPR